MTPEQEISRGEDARRILNEPLFKEAMQQMKDEVIKMWGETPVRDREGREWLWQFYQAATKFENTLVSYMETGKMAALKQKQSLTDKLSNIWS